MNFREALIELRRRMGILSPYSKEDTVWLCEKFVRENRKVFDALS